jgi:hypothetical protein
VKETIPTRCHGVCSDVKREGRRVASGMGSNLSSRVGSVGGVNDNRE